MRHIWIYIDFKVKEKQEKMLTSTIKRSTSRRDVRKANKILFDEFIEILIEYTVLVNVERAHWVQSQHIRQM